jgi:hypothetical protein
VVRASMKVDTLPYEVEELTWQFLDVSDEGGRIAIMHSRRAEGGYLFQQFKAHSSGFTALRVHTLDCSG